MGWLMFGYAHAHARTHTHSHRQVLIDEWSRQGSQRIGSQKRPEGKDFWQGICLAVCNWQNKNLRTISGTLASERERERNKLAILFAEGCLGACIWCYRYTVWWYLSPWRDPGRWCTREGGLVTSHCCKLDNRQLFTSQGSPESQGWVLCCSAYSFVYCDASSLTSDACHFTNSVLFSVEIHMIAEIIPPSKLCLHYQSINLPPADFTLVLE